MSYLPALKTHRRIFIIFLTCSMTLWKKNKGKLKNNLLNTNLGDCNSQATCNTRGFVQSSSF